MPRINRAMRWGLPAAVAVGGILIVIMAWRLTEEKSGATEREGGTQSASSSVAPSQEPGMASSRFDDLGLFVDSTLSGLQVSNRAGATVVGLPDGGLLYLDAVGGCGTSCSLQPLYLSRVISARGRQVLLTLRTAPSASARFEQLNDQTIRLSSAVGASSGADILIWGSDADGGVHRVVIDSRGHLLVDAEPLPGDLAMNALTGEQLDVRGLRRVGRLRPVRTTPLTGSTEWLFTRCDGQKCEVSYTVQALTAPAEGTVRCLDGGQGVELATEEVRLVFRVAPGYGLPNCSNRAAVTAGDLIVPYNAKYTVVALSPAGVQLPLMTTLDGTLYVGSVTPEFRCPPCLQLEN